MLWLLASCALHVREVGLVRVVPQAGSDASTAPATGDALGAKDIALYTEDGRLVALTVNDEEAALRYLHDCIVQVEGARLGGRLVVRDWKVRDGGDGSGGYVGLLKSYGGRLTIDDRNSGMTLVLEDATSGDLRPYVGQEVLVLGHVIGGGLIAPMAWRVLAPTTPER